MTLTENTVGLGLRFDFLEQIHKNAPQTIDFYEIAPENYIGRGGRLIELFEDIAQNHPIRVHGLSVSIGSLDPLNFDYLKQLKAFIHKHNIPYYTDHLCMSSAHGYQFHDLIPLPFTQEAVEHVSAKAKTLQDFLEVPVALENVSFYMNPIQPEMSEADFIEAVIEKSGVNLLLDINNLYVNSINHGSHAHQALNQLIQLPILHCHIAGYEQKYDDLIIDTHGSPISDPVWNLLADYADQKDIPPLLIERDNDIPDLSDMIDEVNKAKQVLQASQKRRVA